MSVMFLLIAARWLPPCHIRPNGKNGQRLALGYHLSLSLFPFFLTKTGMHAYLLTNFYKYEQRSPISYANQNYLAKLEHEPNWDSSYWGERVIVQSCIANSDFILVYMSVSLIKYSGFEGWPHTISCSDCIHSTASNTNQMKLNPEANLGKRP